MKNINRLPIRNILILIVIVLLLIPIIYFFANLGNETFVSNAIGNWFATILGVFAGGVIAYEVANWQASFQDRKNAEISLKERRKRILPIIGWIQDELIDNQGRLSRIESVLNTSPASNKYLWDYLHAIAEGITTNAFNMIITEGLSSELPISFIYLSIAYDTFIGLKNRVRESAAAEVYYNGAGTDLSIISNEMDYIKQLTQLVKQRNLDCTKPLQIDREIISR